MRYLYAALIALLAFVVVVFALQNLGNVTISLFTMGATLPLAVLVILAYLTGMVTGGAVLTLIRTWFERAKPPQKPQDLPRTHG